MTDSALDTEVDALMQTGQKIEAIKLVRQRAGLDLKAAKKYVEQRHPASAAAPANNYVIVLVLALIVIAVLAFLWMQAE